MRAEGDGLVYDANNGNKCNTSVINTGKTRQLQRSVSNTGKTRQLQRSFRCGFSAGGRKKNCV